MTNFPSRPEYLQPTCHGQWARTPPSASWRFESGRDRRRDRTPPPRRGRSPSSRPRREYSPRRDDRYERDYDRRDYDRSRSPDDRDRDVKDTRERGWRDDEHESEKKGWSLFHIEETRHRAYSG